MGFDTDMVELAGFANLDEAVFTGRLIPGLEGKISLNADAANVGLGTPGTDLKMTLAVRIREWTSAIL